jgi:hypothetical protein
MNETLPLLVNQRNSTFRVRQVQLFQNALPINSAGAADEPPTHSTTDTQLRTANVQDDLRAFDYLFKQALEAARWN